MPFTDSAYFVWQGAGKRAAVHLRRRVMAAIDDEMREAFQSVPRRGAETGGILVGSRTVEDGRPIVVVESAEEIRCEHKKGPSFLLSDRDRESLAEQMNRLRAEGLVVVGCYRSHTRTESTSDLEPVKQDVELMEACSPGESSVFLLIRPLTGARALATIFFRHEGSVTKEDDFLPFPFGGRAEPAPIATATATAAGASAAAAPTVPEVRGRSLAWLWLLLFALAGVASGYGLMQFWAEERTASANERAVPFELVADHSLGHLVLSWDPNAAGLREAQEANLLVVDGGNEKRYTLDRAQLLQGSMAYAPSNALVTFTLEAKPAGGRQLRGVLTVVDPPR